ncbi:Exophilin-5 [Manis javanica]|nr:Exophilin-5 [Manis javanica]
MTKAPQGFDFSFLNDEEARKILQVLERNEELQRAEKDRISKLQKTKRDIRWLQGVTGEWFEEIQRKKFCNEMDVSQMLKQPLTYRLRKGMAENDCIESHTPGPKNTPNPRNPTSVPSRLNFRSSFASLFSFRKSRKETSKLRLLGRKGCDGHVGPPVSVRQTITQARIYPPPPEYQPVDSAFVRKSAGMREGDVMLPWDASLLENEFFQVLDDLDSTLAQEQSASSVNTRAPLNHGSTRQFSHFYSSENRHDMSGKGSRKTLHKFKTTSMFSVSGDEDNVKCLEVVSVYYTLPRKPSKKFCSLLQKFTQNIDSLTEATKVETETFSHVLEKDKVNYSTQEQSGTLSAGELKMLVSSAQNSHCLSHATENMTILQLPGIRPSESMLQEIASIEADAPLHKGGPNAGEMSPENIAKTPLSHAQNRRERGVKLQSETLHASSMLQEKEVTEEKSENCQQPVKSGNSGPSTVSSHSDKNVKNSQTIRGSGEYAGHGRAITATRNGRCPQNDVTGIAIDESSSGLHPGESGGGKGAGFQNKTDRVVSDSESRIFALTPTLQKLQLDEKTCLGEPDLDSFQSESSELPQRSQVVNTTKNSKAEGEMQELAQGQPLYPVRSNTNKTTLDDLEKGKSRSSGKHRLAAMSKVGRKFPSKDLSPRRHVATIFPQSGNGSAKCLSFGTPECHPLSPEPTSKSTESTDGSRLNNDGVDVAKSEISNREASIHLSNWKPNSTSQPLKNKLKNISESPPKYENFKDVTVAPILERKSGDLAQGTFTTIREAAFSDHRKRLNSPFPLETADQSIISIPLATCQQQRSASSPEWEPELQPYRSNSLKGINVHGDLLRKSSPPKVRDRHFSESTSIDSALSQLTLGNEFSNNSGYGRKFRSFSELPSCDANESCAVYSGRKKADPLSATSISRPIDYGIFGKDQQLAFLENVKRSLTQGRLWKPSFLKNPGFLKDDIINPPNPAGSSNSNSPRNQMPEDGLFPSAPLNIYEEDPVDSDCNTDTTTDDEYYLDENDKESEL